MRKVFSCLAVVALVAAPAFSGEFNKVVSIGQKAPDFAGIPAVLPDGQDASLTLKDIKEDIIVLVFLANHCPVVLNAEDRIYEFARAYEDKGVKVIGVSCSGNATRQADDLAAIKKRAVQDKKFSYVYGFDESQKIGKDYGAVNTPSFFVLDKDRVIRYMGLMDDSPNNEAKVTKTYLKDAVDALLAGKEIAVKETRPQGCGIVYNR